MFCASEADIVLQKEVVLFCKTTRNRTVFTDHSMENQVKAIRIFTGHKDSSNDKALQVSLVAMELEDLLKTRFDSKHRQDTQEGRRQMTHDRFFFESLLYYRDCRLFSNGAPRHVPSVPFCQRKDDDPSEWLAMGATELMTPSGAFDINPAILNYNSIGLGSLTNYYDAFLGEDADYYDMASPEMGDDTVDLSAIPNLADNVMAKKLQLVERANMMDFNYIMKREGHNYIHNMKELKAELKLLNKELVLIPNDVGEGYMKAVKRDGDKKADWANAIVKGMMEDNASLSRVESEQEKSNRGKSR
jgi:hypothetical protein